MGDLTTSPAGVRRSGSTITYFFETGHEFSYPLAVHPFHRILDMLDEAIDDIDPDAGECNVLDTIMMHRKNLMALKPDDDCDYDEVREAIEFLRCFWT